MIYNAIHYQYFVVHWRVSHSHNLVSRSCHRRQEERLRNFPFIIISYNQAEVAVDCCCSLLQLVVYQQTFFGRYAIKIIVVRLHCHADMKKKTMTTIITKTTVIK